jgi:hypothetical protein
MNKSRKIARQENEEKNTQRQDSSGLPYRKSKGMA